VPIERERERAPALSFHAEREEDGMHSKKGKGLGTFRFLGCGVAALGVAASSEAALITLSGVFTNTSNTAVEKTFTHRILVTENIAEAGVFGALSLLVTDFNRNGASITPGSNPMFSGLIHRTDAGLTNSTTVKAFTPANTALGAFSLSAPSRSMASYETTFGSATAPQAIPSNLKSNDEMEIRLNFTVSAGDQIAYVATFNVVAVPGPSAACAALLAPWIGLHRRRRTENES
jgi:hypothetical protein